MRKYKNYMAGIALLIVGVISGNSLLFTEGSSLVLSAYTEDRGCTGDVNLGQP